MGTQETKMASVSLNLTNRSEIMREVKAKTRSQNLKFFHKIFTPQLAAKIYTRKDADFVLRTEALDADIKKLFKDSYVEYYDVVLVPDASAHPNRHANLKMKIPHKVPSEKSGFFHSTLKRTITPLDPGFEEELAMTSKYLAKRDTDNEAINAIEKVLDSSNTLKQFLDVIPAAVHMLPAEILDKHKRKAVKRAASVKSKQAEISDDVMKNIKTATLTSMMIN